METKINDTGIILRSKGPPFNGLRQLYSYTYCSSRAITATFQLRNHTKKNDYNEGTEPKTFYFYFWLIKTISTTPNTNLKAGRRRGGWYRQEPTHPGLDNRFLPQQPEQARSVHYWGSVLELPERIGRHQSQNSLDR